MTGLSRNELTLIKLTQMFIVSNLQQIIFHCDLWEIVNDFDWKIEWLQVGMNQALSSLRKMHLISYTFNKWKRISYHFHKPTWDMSVLLSSRCLRSGHWQKPPGSCLLRGPIAVVLPRCDHGNMHCVKLQTHWSPLNMLLIPLSSYSVNNFPTCRYALSAKYPEHTKEISWPRPHNSEWSCLQSSFKIWTKIAKLNKFR